MSIENILTIMITMGGIICALVGVIYKILSDRIKGVSITHGDLSVNIASIKTDLKWIKAKLEKL